MRHVSAWYSLEEGVRCYPLTVLVSWAEQDVGRGQENGKLPVASMWGSSGQTQGAWLLPTLPPVPHHSVRHRGLGECHVSPGLSIKKSCPPGRDALFLSSASGRGVRMLSQSFLGQVRDREGHEG